MAMAIVRVNRFTDGRGVLTGIFSLTFSGSYTTGGEACDLRPLIGWVSGRDPFETAFVQAAGGGWKLTYNPALRTVQVWIEQAVATNTPLGEHTAAAYGAGLTGDVSIRLVAKFSKSSGGQLF